MALHACAHPLTTPPPPHTLAQTTNPQPQYAIDAAERGDDSDLHSLLDVLAAPYDDQPGADPKYTQPPPEDMAGKPGVCMLSCSS